MRSLLSLLSTIYPPMSLLYPSPSAAAFLPDATRCATPAARAFGPPRQPERPPSAAPAPLRSAADSDGGDSDDGESPSTLRSVTFSRLGASSEPQLLSDFLMELGACSATVTDHDRDTPDESPVYREPTGAAGEVWESASPPGGSVAAAAVVCGDAAVGRNVWSRCDVTAHFPASFDLGRVADAVRDAFDLPEAPEYRVGDVPDRDWVAHVQGGWRPITAAGFVLRFPWHTDEDVERAVADYRATGAGGEGEWPEELRLEGGVAFGTGEHPTTRLCLGFVRDAVLRRGARRVLDYGAGSGILGLAACALSPGASAVGVDIDVDAVRIADRNARTNGLPMRSYLPPPRLLGRGGDPESDSLVMRGRHRVGDEAEMLPRDWDGPVFDACAANVLAGPLIGLAATISSMLRPGGWIGLSGILVEQAEKVVEAYSEYFDDVKVAGEEGGWVLITGRRVAKCGMEIL